MDFKAHWEAIHEENSAEDVSWYQAIPTLSLDFVEKANLRPEAGVLDVGCGQAGLAGPLVERGFQKVTALDVSGEAIRRARERLGERSAGIEWIEADILDFSAPKPFELWHDRAVLHFFTAAKDQQRYVESLHRNLARGGHAIIAGFATDGPEKCSALPVVRRNAASLARLVGPEFDLVDSLHAVHTTPWGKSQAFEWAVFRRK